jgi:hypothetical protein
MPESRDNYLGFVVYFYIIDSFTAKSALLTQQVNH